MCGAFSDKWLDVSKSCGKEADHYPLNGVLILTPSLIDEKLSTGEYDLITLVHNETSCGMMNPLEEIMTVLSKYPNVLSVIDTVSSFSVVPIPKRRMGHRCHSNGLSKSFGTSTWLSFIFSIPEELLKELKRLKEEAIISTSSNSLKIMKKE